MLEQLAANSPALQAIAQLFQVIVTLALLITTKYTISQSWKQIREMVQQRRDNVLPIVIPKNFNFANKSPKQKIYCIDCEITNIGNGPAFEITIHFYDSETDKMINQYTHSLDYLKKGRSEMFHLHARVKDFDKLRYTIGKSGSMESRLVTKVHFTNIYGKVFHVENLSNLERLNGKFKIKPVLGTLKFRHAEGEENEKDFSIGNLYLRLKRVWRKSRLYHGNHDHNP